MFSGQPGETFVERLQLRAQLILYRGDLPIAPSTYYAVRFRRELSAFNG